MTLLLARILAAPEIATVVHAGFEGFSSDDAVATDVALVRLWRVPGESGGDRLLWSTGADEARAVRAFGGAFPDPQALSEAAAKGAGGILIETVEPFAVRSGLVALSALRARCLDLGLDCGLGGDIEPPDIPRLLALRPDFLVMGRILRRGGAADATLDPDRLAMVRDLVPRRSLPVAAEPGPPVAGAASRRAPDRIFLRDHVLDIEIGAYRSERGRRQRVRFGVEADLRAADRRAGDMRDVVSYDLFTDAIRLLTSGRHVDFVETLAEEIAAEVLAHPRVLAVRVTIEKLDVGSGSVGVSIERGDGDRARRVAPNAARAPV